MNLLQKLIDLFAPNLCLGCGTEGDLLCSRCAFTLPSLQGACLGCHVKVDGVVCEKCLPVTGCNSVVAVTDYRGLAKSLIMQLKFYNNASAARSVAMSVAQHIPAPLPGVVIVSVPATAAHVRERGYDQAALIARHLARYYHRKFASPLRRLGKRHQFGADRAHRHTQLAGQVFVGRPLRFRQVILVDDVLTTGASLAASAQALRRAGATCIDAVVFAQAIKNPPLGRVV